MRRSLTREKNGPHEQSPAAGSAQETESRAETSGGNMRIRTDTAASAVSLAEYLRRCECIVDVIDRRTIAATVRPRSFAAAHTELELDGYLTVWQAMHPDVLIERLTPLPKR